jgi:hypothetical protein
MLDADGFERFASKEVTDNIAALVEILASPLSAAGSYDEAV